MDTKDYEYNGFQFLIGNLKTKAPVAVDDQIVEFQFLIGNLKTVFSAP